MSIHVLWVSSATMLGIHTIHIHLLFPLPLFQLIVACFRKYSCEFIAWLLFMHCALCTIWKQCFASPPRRHSQWGSCRSMWPGLVADITSQNSGSIDVAINACLHGHISFVAAHSLQ